MRFGSRTLRVLAFVLVAHACTTAPTEEFESASSALDHPGAWSIPTSTLALGDEQYVPYTGAGLWNDGADCAGGLTTGAAIVRSYLLEHFPQTEVIGGYSCRQNTANTAYMSIHAVGRALDIMLPLSNADADNDLGDPIGNWLIENAEAIGIQFIIWDEWTWMAARTPGDKGRLYTGPNPHHDHLHVELSEEASARTTNWFSGLVTPPVKAGCVALGPYGGVVDDLDPCFESFGPSAYWRHETGVGYGGSLIWTNAWMAAEPSNWARWNVVLDEAGDYEVEVFLTSPFAVYPATRYSVRHAGVDDVIVVDQALEAAGSPGTWVSLGVYPFAAGSDQSVSVFDDSAVAVPPDQHVVVDAVRWTRLGVTPPEGPIDEAMPPSGTFDPDVDPATEPRGNSGRAGGCVVSRSESGASSGILAAALGVLLARRSRTRRRVRPGHDDDATVDRRA